MILSKEGFIHHLNNVEGQAKWVEYYNGESDFQQVPQKSLELSKQILTEFFDGIGKEVYIVLSKTQPEIVDFTYYTELEEVEKRVGYLNKLVRREEFWHITLFSNHRNLEEENAKV